MFYFGQKGPIKVPILTLSSAPVKICRQTSLDVLQTTSQFFFKFFFSVFFSSLFNAMKDNLLPQVMHSVIDVLPCAYVTCIRYSLI